MYELVRTTDYTLRVVECISLTEHAHTWQRLVQTYYIGRHASKAVCSILYTMYKVDQMYKKIRYPAPRNRPSYDLLDWALLRAMSQPDPL